MRLLCFAAAAAADALNNNTAVWMDTNYFAFSNSTTTSTTTWQYSVSSSQLTLLIGHRIDIHKICWNFAFSFFPLKWRIGATFRQCTLHLTG